MFNLQFAALAIRTGWLIRGGCVFRRLLAKPPEAGRSGDGAGRGPGPLPAGGPTRASRAARASVA